MAETSARGKVSRAEPSKATRAASRRAAESKATIPHLYMAADLDLGGHADLLDGAAGEPGAIDLIVRAAGMALRDVPRLNGAYRDGAAETYERVNIGISVAGPDGVVVATLFDADAKPLADIAAERVKLERRAAAGELTAAELAGGTFTVAGAGPHIRSFAPVIHGGQAGNLGIGGSSERTVVATLVADARMVDAPTAAAFLAALGQHAEGRAA